MPKSNIIFSTNPDFDKQENISPQQPNLTSQNLRLHLDRRGGGKIVTIIKGFKGSNSHLLALCSVLKKKFSIGGTAKNGTILLQGNIRDRLLKYLIDNGYEAKPSGG